VNGIAEANQAYGALNESLHMARFSLERAFRAHLEPLINGDAWQKCATGFDDINAFMDSLRLDKFKVIAEQRKQIVNRIKELQPDVSNRQIGRTLGISHETVNRDVGTNVPHRASYTGNYEWYTPAEYIERARRVLGVIDLDPASSALAQETVKAGRYFSEKDDGLSQEWLGRVWLNPPYAQPAIEQFIDKLIEETTAGRTSEAILLTHNSTDTAWFHKAAIATAAICFTRGRIAFIDTSGERDAPTQGQAFFFFGQNTRPFEAEFSGVGFVAGPLTAEAAA
jgi:phage N-6-adenine-methyltransferase